MEKIQQIKLIKTPSGLFKFIDYGARNNLEQLVSSMSQFKDQTIDNLSALQTKVDNTTFQDLVDVTSIDLSDNASIQTVRHPDATDIQVANSSLNTYLAYTPAQLHGLTDARIHSQNITAAAQPLSYNTADVWYLTMATSTTSLVPSNIPSGYAMIVRINNPSSVVGTISYAGNDLITTSGTFYLCFTSTDGVNTEMIGGVIEQQ